MTTAPFTAIIPVALLLAGCGNEPPLAARQRTASLEAGERLSRTEAAAEQTLLTLPGPTLSDTDERPRLRLLLRTQPDAEPVEVAPAAIDAAHGPDGKVAFVDATGLHFWVQGRARLVAPAVAHGLAARAAGVLFVSPALRGGGAGLSFASWDGELRLLIPAAEDLPGPAGLHHPALSPDGRYAIAWSNLTPRPSLWRVTLLSGVVEQLAADAPAGALAPRWERELLVWTDPDGRQVALEPASGVLELR